ncbi:hypothetical protein KIN20_014194 [Parelaphostrongylus tenuis]|uniref:Uncharacterized protein n=1 Tax=Parelaphostrongylus tenuis TaxID=148309 RepID=A0AAD5MX16_PARTN|nr:hypothetical protein KIN20_014194 [Parelaphostrongylus tenuis]
MLIAVRGMVNMFPHCIIVGSTVTSTCGPTNSNQEVDCGMTNALKMTVPIAVDHTTITGTVTGSTVQTVALIICNGRKVFYMGNKKPSTVHHLIFSNFSLLGKRESSDTMPTFRLLNRL